MSSSRYPIDNLMRFEESGVLANGNAVNVCVRGAAMPMTVWVRPTGGDTVTVSYSCDGGANYAVWPAGAVTVYTEDTLMSGVTHLRLQRTAGSGTASSWGVC